MVHASRRDLGPAGGRLRQRGPWIDPDRHAGSPRRSAVSAGTPQAMAALGDDLWVVAFRRAGRHASRHDHRSKRGTRSGVGSGPGRRCRPARVASGSPTTGDNTIVRIEPSPPSASMRPSSSVTAPPLWPSTGRPSGWPTAGVGTVSQIDTGTGEADRRRHLGRRRPRRARRHTPPTSGSPTRAASRLFAHLRRRPDRSSGSTSTTARRRSS